MGAGVIGSTRGSAIVDIKLLIEMGRRGRAYYLAHFERDMLMARFEAWCAELAGQAALRNVNSA